MAQNIFHEDVDYRNHSLALKSLSKNVIQTDLIIHYAIPTPSQQIFYWWKHLRYKEYFQEVSPAFWKALYNINRII